MKTFVCAIAATFGLATAVAASPISVTYYTGADLNNANSPFYTAFDGLTSGYIIEDFEDRSGFTGTFETVGQISAGGEGEIADSVGTSVGSFTTLGGTGSGSTCARLDLDGSNRCDNIAIQHQPSINGQGNTVPFGGNWSINTADTKGLEWTVDTGSMFNSLVFVLRDPGDQGAKTLSITAAGGVFTDTVLNNEEILLVQVLFGTAQSTATIEIRTSQNDAFNFDGAAVNVVPLPAAGWMLLAGLGGLAAMRRRARG